MTAKERERLIALQQVIESTVDYLGQHNSNSRQVIAGNIVELAFHNFRRGKAIMSFDECLIRHNNFGFAP